MIGRHLSSVRGAELSYTSSLARELDYDIFQIFLGTPQNLITKPRPLPELKELGQSLVDNEEHMVIHGSYTINLCHPVDSPKGRASVRSLVQDLKASAVIGDRCLGVIIHMGKNIPDLDLTTKQALSNYRKGLRAALRSTPHESRIILETGAGQGSEVGSDIEGLAAIYHGLAEKDQARISFCIDTCHIWAFGYDIATPKGVRAYFREFDQAIGVEKISCIHFNNSRTACGSCVDRHDDLTHGLIDPKGLEAVAKYAVRHQIPLVMETPQSSYTRSSNPTLSELNIVRRWCGLEEIEEDE